MWNSKKFEKFNEGKISFNFFALTTQSLTIDVKIILFVNLVGKNGMDENATDITCSLTSAVAIEYLGTTTMNQNQKSNFKKLNETIKNA